MDSIIIKPNAAAPEAVAVTYVSTASLKPFERNSRLHSDKQIQQIAASIRQFGFNIAIRIEELIDNHKIRDWVHKIDVQNAMLNDIEDFLFSMKGRYDLGFSTEELDHAMQLLLNVAKRREGYGN